MTTTSGATSITAGQGPGRLGDPSMDLRHDPRADPRMVAALAPFGLDVNGAPPPVGVDSPLEARLEFVAAAEAGFEAVFAALGGGLPEVDGVDRTTRTIAGPDGNEVTLFVSRPHGQTGPLPGVLHLHGGGMVILSAAGPVYGRFRDSLARAGAVVVGVQYRNAGGVLGPHPFPAGLQDCAAALDWMHAHREELGIRSLSVVGESGGANLSLATTLKAKRDARLAAIDGVYAMVPYISGLYDGSPRDRATVLPSLVENDEYFIGCAITTVMASVYDPTGEHRTDPLAWPYHASVDDVTGLPPHVISVNELDPLRDEGIAYHDKLRAAGVPVTLRRVPGVCHAGDIMFPAAMPDLYAQTVDDVHAFVDGL